MVLALSSHWSCLVIVTVYGINMKIFLFLGMKMPIHIHKAVIRKEMNAHKCNGIHFNLTLL